MANFFRKEKKNKTKHSRLPSKQKLMEWVRKSCMHFSHCWSFIGVQAKMRSSSDDQLHWTCFNMSG